MPCCPNSERLGRFLNGRDDDSGRDAVEDHIEGCAACREALERLTGGSHHPTLPRLAEAIQGLDRRPGVPPAEATQPEAAGHPSPPGRGDGPRPPTAASRYVRVRHHQRGGLGLVSVAVDTELDREVAFKEILPEQADRPQSRARFLLEAAVTARLEHPGIVPVYGQGVTDRGRPFYAMQFVRGESLKRAVEHFHDRAVAVDPSARSLAFRDLLRRFIDVCNTIAYAHDRGVLHRDLKPSNILLGPFGETVVIDWGLAKLVGPVGDDLALDESAAPLRPIDRSTCETVVGAAIGSPSYMSPEQADGRSDSVGTACDIYGLGATLYAILSGKPPREGGDVRMVLDAARSGAFPPPRAVNRDGPPALEAVCLKAMAQRPDDRYRSARALAEDVERWLAGEPVSAWREPWSVRLGRAFDRNRTAAVASAAALFVASLAAGYLAYGARIRAAERRSRAEGWVRTLETAETRQLPQILEQLRPDRPWVDPLLIHHSRQPTLDPKARLHLALARAARDPGEVDWLSDRLLVADPDQLRVICTILGDQRDALIARLRRVLEDPEADPARRFRAACALVLYDP